MKKIKMMLLSVALFAVVGGALAFKAKLGSTDFCYTQVDPNSTAGVCVEQVCPLESLASTTDPTGSKIYCTTTKFDLPCNNERPCAELPAISIKAN